MGKQGLIEIGQFVHAIGISCESPSNDHESRRSKQDEE